MNSNVNLNTFHSGLILSYSIAGFIYFYLFYILSYFLFFLTYVLLYSIIHRGILKVLFLFYSRSAPLTITESVMCIGLEIHIEHPSMMA